MADETDSGARRAKQYKNSIICAGCGSEVAQRSGNQKYCAACRVRIYQEDSRKNEERKRREAGIIAIGSELRCGECSATYVKINGAQKCCPTCAAAKRAIYERESKRRYEAKAPPRKRNSEKDINRQKAWNLKNREKLRRRSQEYNDRNRDIVNRKARERNKTQKRRAYLQQWEAEKKASDPRFTLNARMRANLKRGLREGKGGRAWSRLAGYSVDQLFDHLERQFLTGMSWANMGDWHIDHRQPLASFKFETAEDPEFKAAWALTNLQPLWNVDNWSKGGKRLLLI